MKCTRNGYITEDQWRAAAATPLGTIRYGSSEKFAQQGGYFMEEVRRELIKQFGENAEDGPEQPLCRRAVGAQLDGPQDPGRSRPGASRRARQVRRRPRLDAISSKSIDIDGDWAGAARPRAGRHRLPRLAEGGGPVEERRRGDDRLHQWHDRARFPPRLRRCRCAVQGGAAFDALSPGMIIIVKQIGAGQLCAALGPEVSGGMVAEEVHTGRVLAMQGGFDVVGSSYNRATQALRQPGSAFKPIVYVTALENGFTPATIEEDAPFCVWQGAGLGNKCFVNFDRRYAGPKTMRWGVEQSRNLMTVRAASTVGMPKITDTARKLGVGDYGNYLSFALGAGDTTVLRLTNAYAILANQGRAVKPTTIDYVEDRNGKVIYRSDNRCALMGNCNAPDWNGKAMPRPPNRTRQLLDPMAAFQMVHIMEGVIQRGTATVLRDLNRPLFGKTGTTNGPTNVWFVGGTPDIVAGVYLGYDQPRPHGRLGPGRADLRADLEAMGADGAQGPAQGAVRRAARHPLGAHRSRHRQAGVRRVPDHRRSQVVGDLGSVPAADRAAANASTARWAILWPAAGQRQAAEPAAAAASRSAQQRPRRRPRRRRQPRDAAPPPPAGLPTQNGVQ